jgi:hypothetical protein
VAAWRPPCRLWTYTLIAAGNIVYDGWQAVSGRRLSDRTLLLATRLLAVVTLAAALGLSLLFERLRDAWIFMSTVLLSTVLWPLLAVLFLPRLATPRSGRWSAIIGLGVSLTLFVVFQTLGSPTDDESLAVAFALAGRSPRRGAGGRLPDRAAGLLVPLRPVGSRTGASEGVMTVATLDRHSDARPRLGRGLHLLPARPQKVLGGAPEAARTTARPSRVWGPRAAPPPVRSDWQPPHRSIRSRRAARALRAAAAPTAPRSS